MARLLDLPPEILGMIVNLVEIDDARGLLRTCRLMHEVAMPHAYFFVFLDEDSTYLLFRTLTTHPDRAKLVRAVSIWNLPTDPIEVLQEALLLNDNCGHILRTTDETWMFVIFSKLTELVHLKWSHSWTVFPSAATWASNPVFQHPHLTEVQLGDFDIHDDDDDEDFTFSLDDVYYLLQCPLIEQIEVHNLSSKHLLQHEHVADKSSNVEELRLWDTCLSKVDGANLLAKPRALREFWYLHYSPEDDNEHFEENSCFFAESLGDALRANCNESLECLHLMGHHEESIRSIGSLSGFANLGRVEAVAQMLLGELNRKNAKNALSKILPELIMFLELTECTIYGHKMEAAHGLAMTKQSTGRFRLLQSIELECIDWYEDERAALVCHRRVAPLRKVCARIGVELSIEDHIGLVLTGKKHKVDQVSKLTDGQAVEDNASDVNSTSATVGSGGERVNDNPESESVAEPFLGNVAGMNGLVEKGVEGASEVG